MKIKIPLPANLDLHARQFFDNAKAGGLEAKSGKDVTELDLYGDIGFFGVTAADIRRALKGAKDVKLRIHSRGGDVFDGIAIYNDLIDHNGKIDVEIPGLAASAASIIAMAGHSIKIAESGRLMIHNAWGLVVGNRHDMVKVADVLVGIDKSLARIYADRTGIGVRAIAQMMDDETWLIGKDAVEQGFADDLLDGGDGTQARERLDLRAYKHAPEDWAKHEDEETEVTIREVERALRDAGCSKQRAKTLAARAFGRDDGREAGREQQTVKIDVLPFRRDAEADHEAFAVALKEVGLLH